MRYDSPEQLAAAAAQGEVDLGIDSTALVQEFVPARGGHIVRVEVLGGKYPLRDPRVQPGEDVFNICPADACQTTSGVALVGARLRASTRRKTAASASRATRRRPR